MPDPKAQAQAQLDRVLATTGLTLAQAAEDVQQAGLSKHGQMLKHFKTHRGLGHGDANRLAHAVREHLAGGPPDPAALIDAQYAGRKAPLRPLYARLRALCEGLGPDVEVVVQKTGVSFRRAKQFALVQAPSAKRVQLGLNLDETPDDPRVVAARGMCNHKVDLRSLEEIDAGVEAALAAAYARAG